MLRRKLLNFSWPFIFLRTPQSEYMHMQWGGGHLVSRRRGTGKRRGERRMRKGEEEEEDGGGDQVGS